MFKGKKKMKVFLLLVLSLVIIASGCGSKDKSVTPSGSGDSGSAEVVGKADKNTLVVANMSDARVVDPHQSGESPTVNALFPVVETLLKYDEDGSLQPLLAESYEQVDETTWKFNLRKGVKFHNGEEMKASDVVYSFKRAASPIGAKVQYIMKIVDAENLEIVDDYTVIIRTTKPFSPFASYMPYIGASIISEKAYEQPEAEHHPIGTGPFEFVEWKKGDRLVYKRFEGYWGEKPEHENLIIKTIPEANSRLIELETGGADIATNMTVNDMSKIEGNPNLQLLTSPTTVFTYITYNTSKAPFDNLKFRQALDWAINEEAVVAAVHRGAARYTPGPITPDQNYFDSSDPNCRYDVEKAKQLLAESGVDVSKPITITVNENQPRIDLATIVQSQLKEIGITLEIKVMESASFYNYIVTGEQEMIINGWGAVGFPDPDNNIYGPLHSDQIPANNSSFYSNKKLDEMLDRSREVADGPDREKLMIEIQQLIREEVPYITFDNPTNLVGVQKYIKNFAVMPTSHQIYNDVVIE